MPKTFLKAITLADTALEMISKCSFTKPVNSDHFYRGLWAHRISVLSQLRSLRFEKCFSSAPSAVLLLLAMLSAPVIADDVSDPMRPFVSGSGVGAQRASSVRWVVTGILISPERRLAMINDRLIGVGEKVDGARVRTIRGNGVELDVNGRLIFLKHETDSVRLSEKENK